jgi:hypothetical protein
MTVQLPPLVAPPRVAVVREWLHLDDERCGVEYGDYNGVDQSAKVQAAIDLAGALHSSDPGTVFVGGIVTCRTAGLSTVNASRPVRILGADGGKSDSPSALHFPVDLGAGESPLKLGNNYRLANIAILGPGASSPVSAGELPAQMNGVYFPTRGIARDVLVTGFRNGAAVVNDHQEWWSCDFRGNGYGMEWIDNPLDFGAAHTGGLGDHLIARSFMTECTRASIGIASSNAIANARFIGNGHCGGSPFGLHRYFGDAGDIMGATGSAASNVLTGVDVVPNDTDPLGAPFIGQRVTGTNIADGTKITAVTGSPGNYTVTLNQNPTGPVTSIKRMLDRNIAMAGVVFENWSWEGWRHANWYDEPGDAQWTNVTFFSEGEANGFGEGNPLWPGKPTDLAAYDLGYVDSFAWINGASSNAPPNRHQIRARQIANVHIDNGAILFRTIDGDPGIRRPFKIKSGYYGDVSTANIVAGAQTKNVGSSSYSLGALKAIGDITKGDLLELSSHSFVRVSQNNAGSQIVGFALDNYSEDDEDVAVYVTTGRGAPVHNTGASTINSGDTLTPDPANAGGVKKRTSLSEPCVAYQHEGSIVSGAIGFPLVEV